MKRAKSFLWYYVFPFLVLLIAVLLIITAFSGIIIRQNYFETKEDRLKTNSTYIATIIQDNEQLTIADEQYILLNDFARSTLCRITIINSAGFVIFDSEKDPALMEDHSERPEILEAYRSGYGIETRYSKTLGKEMMYVALKVQAASGRLIVRTSLAYDALTSQINQLYRKICYAGIIISILAILAGVIISRRLRIPIDEISNGARKFGEGEFEHFITVGDPKELAGLSKSLNTMAMQLKDRIDAVIHQRNELQAVLSSMKEAVIVIDREHEIQRFNNAAEELFGMSSDEAAGKPLEEVVRNFNFLNMVEAIEKKKQLQENELLLHSLGDKIIWLQATPIYSIDNTLEQILIVFNDITEIKRLERIRKDFVANVSHELKTPLTSIKGSVETIFSESVKFSEKDQRFLSIIEKNVNRMSAILDDLLVLSRLESGHKNRELDLKTSRLSRVMQEAADVCMVSAQKKNIEIVVESDPEDLKVMLDFQLFEEALINLLDNAVKFSPENSCITLKAFKENGRTVVQVTDQGKGIDSKHKDRIFERFYLVDKARSRKMGGTGLGLSIVKHIVMQHNGSISVESRTGKGSVFTIVLE